MTSLGTPTGVKNWNDRLSKDYPAPMGFVQPRMRMAGIDTLVGLLQEDEAFAWFKIVHAVTESGKGLPCPKIGFPLPIIFCATTCSLLCFYATPTLKVGFFSPPFFSSFLSISLYFFSSFLFFYYFILSFFFNACSHNVLRLTDCSGLVQVFSS